MGPSGASGSDREPPSADRVDDWYQHVSVQGTVGDIHDDVDLHQIDRLSTHYTGKPYPNRESPRVFTHLTIDRWHGWKA